MTLKGCWHVRDKDRLMGNLRWKEEEKWGVCDLYPLSGHAEGWFSSRMKLSIGDRVQFCCKGSIVAEGTIASYPRERTAKDPPKDSALWNPNFPSVVTIQDVMECPTPKQCECYKRTPWHGSHRLGGHGPCS